MLKSGEGCGNDAREPKKSEQYTGNKITLFERGVVIMDGTKTSRTSFGADGGCDFNLLEGNGWNEETG